MRKAFTFVELILYVGIVAVIISAIIPLSWAVIEGAAESGVQQEVWSTGRLITEMIKREIRNSSGINSVTADSISLGNFSPADNPTVITFTYPDLTIKKGSAAAVRMNPEGIRIGTMVFTNYSSGDGKSKHIQFYLKVESLNGSLRQEYRQSLIIDSSAEVRSL
jgi:hypothetical protein